MREKIEALTIKIRLVERLMAAYQQRGDAARVAWAQARLDALKRERFDAEWDDFHLGEK